MSAIDKDVIVVKDVESAEKLCEIMQGESHPLPKMRNRHDMLMQALKEIKDVCTMSEDYDLGCGKDCPFLQGKEDDAFRGCEVMQFLRTDYYTPSEWGEEEECQD